MIPPETLRELTQLRERVAYLEAEVALLRDTRSTQLERVKTALGVSVGEARALVALGKGGLLTRDQAMGLHLSRVSDCDLRSLDSIVKRLRRRLPWLKITTHYGLGYEIEDRESLKRVRAALEEPKQ